MTRDDVLQALLSLVPPAEADGMMSPNNGPVYQAVAHGISKFSERRIRTSQAKYLLPHSLQKAPPASFLRRARYRVELTRVGNTDLAMRSTARFSCRPRTGRCT